jgi:hypothetical protein
MVLSQVNIAGNGVGTKGAAVLVKVLAVRLTPLEVYRMCSQIGCVLK